MPRPRNRKQLLLKLGVFLLLGVVVNVAVAWGVILGTDEQRLLEDSRYRNLTSDEVSRLFFRYALPEWKNHEHDFGFHMKELDITALAVMGELDPAVGNVIQYRIDEHQYGLPFRSLRNAKRWGLGAAGSGTVAAEHLYSLTFAKRELPICVIWPGFAINTAFYAALLWVLFYGPGKIRRLVRIRRGCCPACGYKIAPAPGGGIGPRCSECGYQIRD